MVWRALVIIIGLNRVCFNSEMQVLVRIGMNIIALAKYREA
jgi:hypothetical protein